MTTALLERPATEPTTAPPCEWTRDDDTSYRRLTKWERDDNK